MREHFQSTFQGNHALQLQRHPMILHAYFAKAVLLKTYDFLQDFSGPLYEWASTNPFDPEMTTLAKLTFLEFRSSKLNN